MEELLKRMDHLAATAARSATMDPDNEDRPGSGSAGRAECCHYLRYQLSQVSTLLSHFHRDGAGHGPERLGGGRHRPPSSAGLIPSGSGHMRIPVAEGRQLERDAVALFGWTDVTMISTQFGGELVVISVSPSR
jgi:hypothetical protein